LLGPRYQNHRVASIYGYAPLIRGFVFGPLPLLLLLLRLVWLVLLLGRTLRLLPLLGARIVRLKRLTHLRVAIRLFGEAQEGLGQTFKLLAKKLVLLRLGEHIGCSQAVRISLPRHWLAPMVDLIPAMIKVMMRRNGSGVGAAKDKFY